jgi:hypothetical protein
VAKVKLEAGAEFDMLDHKEMSDILDDFVIKLGHGVKFRRIVNYFDVAANQVVNTAGFGPDPGFLWDVRYMHCDAGNAAVPGSTVIYLGGIAPVNQVGLQSNVALTAGQFYNKQILCHSGENLIFQLNASTIASPIQLAVAVHVIEVPLFHEGQLLL